ncbi:hypothetical protein M758_12G037800 [Ceratodon purpureus]|nr:hypothetical protein M758_12G037800 [Ceratodon purpureus]
MLEIKQVTGAGGDEHEGMQSGNSTATSMSLRETVCLCTQRSMTKESKGASENAFHVDGFEPQADDVVRPSALHLAERIFKKLMKLRKKAALCSMYASCMSFPFEPCREGNVSEAEPRTHSLDSVDAERDVRCGYDSDEHSAGFVSIGTPTSSSSSFDSLATSHGASTISVSASEHKSGSQMMANMLLSLLSTDHGFTLDEADDEADSGEDSEDFHFSGPRASAWHQPEEEILTEQEWRMMRYGSKPAMASISGSSTPRLYSKASSSKALSSFTILPPHHSSTTLGSKPRDPSKHM